MFDIASLNRLLSFTSKRVGEKLAMRKRFQKLLADYSPFINFPIIKIAGTNGKGSTAAMLSSVLTTDGKKVGLFTSPHLVKINERFRIDLAPIEDAPLRSVADEIEQAIYQFVERHADEYTPSFFEVLLVLALKIFHQQQVDIAIIEAGVGGKNDASSLLPNLLSVITTIGMDHATQLGRTLESISQDKAGIALPNSDLILGFDMPENFIGVIKNANKVNIIRTANYIQSAGDSTVIVSIDGVQILLHPKLKGSYQLDNLNTVLACCLQLKSKGLLKDWQSVRGINQTRWEGRFEKIGKWTLDAAHNEHALNALIHALNENSSSEERVLLFGMARDKDKTKIADLLPKLASTVYFTDDFYRATPKEAWNTTLGKPTALRLEALLVHIEHQHPQKFLLATGSIFMIGKIREMLLAKPSA